MASKAYTAGAGPLQSGAQPTPGELARELCAGWPPEGARGVLDPACGAGELLLAAWRASRRPERLALHGIEIDAALCASARERLRAVLGGEAGERAAARVVCADALDPAVPWPAGTHVVANPPWVSLSGRQAPPAVAPAVARAAESGAGGWPSVHGAYLGRIARHVAQESTGARVLLPGSVAELERYGPLRASVTAQVRLSRAPVELGEDRFPDVVGPAIWIELVPAWPGCGGSAASWSPPSAEGALLAAALRLHPRLPASAFGDPGVHTGNARAELVQRCADPGLPGLREGRDLGDYHLGPPRAWLRTDLSRTRERRFRVKPLATYRAIPVLVRQTADRPRAALHTAPTFFRNSLLACVPPPGLDPAFVVGVLNSRVAAAWHRALHRDARQRAFPQVKVAHLRALPFPMAQRSERPRLHDAVAERVRRLAASGPRVALVQEVEELVLEAYRLPAPLREQLRTGP